MKLVLLADARLASKIEEEDEDEEEEDEEDEEREDEEEIAEAFGSKGGKAAAFFGIRLREAILINFSSASGLMGRPSSFAATYCCSMVEKAGTSFKPSMMQLV